ncbi:hypothetical protein PLIIFM63780_002303 [Purpureocillium lilacinum]|nr:hypothetical protein PLIIFM63780_002303 [Purpureocillium lilacinum]
MTELTNPVQQQRTQSAATDEKLIIALDFGTTYSGVSYCFANQRDPKPHAAAEIAEISNITLIKEPEAAALYTAKSLDFCISRDDAFVICDAGGGTVDLVSYEVEAVLPRLKVRELVPGTALSQLVGDEQWPALKKSKAFFLADKQFDEKTKRDFKGAEDEEHYVNFPTAQLEDDPENGLQSNSWTLTG